MMVRGIDAMAPEILFVPTGYVRLAMDMIVRGIDAMAATSRDWVE